jgi:hypothetical protein
MAHLTAYASDLATKTLLWTDGKNVAPIVYWAQQQPPQRRPVCPLTGYQFRAMLDGNWED